MSQDPKNEEFFDATVDEVSQQQDDTPKSILEAKKRAEHEAKMLATIADDFTSNKKQTFRRTVIMSVGSVVFLLILAIIFFVFLKWYGAGVGVAILALITSQVWLHFFKKWDKRDSEYYDLDYEALGVEDDFLESDNDKIIKSSTASITQEEAENAEEKEKEEETKKGN